jgi:glycosyltransferase involved in cell wall biosynthesis
MRILLITPMPPDAEAAGAIPVILHAQLVGLGEHHDLAIVTVAGPDARELAAVDRLQSTGVELHVVRRVLPVGRARWRRRGRMAGAWLRGPQPWRTVWFAEPGVQRVLDRLLARRAFDAVAVEDNAMAGYRLPAHLPSILTEHEVRRPRPLDLRVGPPGDWPAWASREIDWRRWPRYQRALWPRYDAVQVFTERDAQGVRMLAPDVVPRLRVNPFGIVVPPRRTEREDPDTALFVGNFTHAPNVDAALWLGHELMPRLRAMGVGMRLAIAGIDPPAPVRALAAPDVRVLGFVEDVETLIAQAAIVLAPVRIGGGMRMKVLHAMALGKAVVTTSRGAEGLAAPPVAIVDGPHDAAVATARLLADDAERARLGRCARDFVAEHHSARAYARRLEQVYAFAMDHHRVTRS